MASQYKGVWVRKEAADTMRVGDFLSKESLPPAPIGGVATATVSYHQKHPALSQREISQITDLSAAKAKFRMTSDKYMNAENAPNRFESMALGRSGTVPGAMDVDHFKSINDRYGHLAGDSVLVLIARVCQESTHKTDLVGRFGGEEFLILRPETTAAEGVLYADRLRANLASHAVLFEGTEIRVTVSIGGAENTED